MDQTDTQLLSSTSDRLATIWLGVSGGHRSGTTILAHILNQHPEVGLFVEYGLENYIRSVDAIFARSDAIQAYDTQVIELAGRAAEGVIPIGHSAAPDNARLVPSPEMQAASREADAVFGRSDEIQAYDTQVTKSAGQAAEGAISIGHSAASGNTRLVPSPEMEAAAREADAFYQRRDHTMNFAHTGPFRPVRLLHSDDMLLAAYRIVFPGRRLRVVGDKMPQFRERNDLVWLRQRLPTFRLVHIVRSPLDVVNSSLNRRNKTRIGTDVWHVTTVGQAAAEWITEWNWAMATKAKLGDDMLIIKYGDLSSDTASVLRRIEAFLGLSQPLQPTFMALPETLRLYAMDAAERSQAEAWFRVVTEAWPDRSFEELAVLFPTLPAICPIGETIDFRVGGNALAYTSVGFSVAEQDGTWTDGESAEIVANFGMGAGLFRLSGSYVPIAYCEQLRVLVNGVVAGTVMVGPSAWVERGFSLEVMHKPTARGGTVIRFELDRPKLQEEHPQDDPRGLGILLKWLRVEPIADSSIIP